MTDEERSKAMQEHFIKHCTLKLDMSVDENGSFTDLVTLRIYSVFIEGYICGIEVENNV